MSSNPANTLPPQYDEALPNDYDPEFTADISTKMRVPERIGAERGDDTMGHLAWTSHPSNMNVPEKIVLAGQESSIGMRDDPKLHYDPLDGSTYVGLQTPPRVLTLENRQQFPDTEEKGREEDDDDLVWPPLHKSRQDTSLQNGFVSPSPAKHSSGGVMQDTLVTFMERTGLGLTQVIERAFQNTTETSPHGELLPSDSLTMEASMSIPGDGLLIRDEQAEGDVVALRRQMAKLSRHVMRLEEENSKRSQREVILYPLVIGYMLFKMAKWFVQGR